MNMTLEKNWRTNHAVTHLPDATRFYEMKVNVRVDQG